MAITTTYTCDVCGVPKKETNHWFMASTDEDGRIHLATWEQRIPPVLICVEAHLCGRECVHKWIDRQLGSTVQIANVREVGE